MSRVRIAAQIVIALAAVSAFVPRLSRAHEGWGIVVDAQGRIYVADIPANTIWRFSSDGRSDAILRNVHSHALVLGADGFIYGTDVALTGSNRGVWKLDLRGGKSNVIAPAPLPLDLAAFLVAPNGTIYSPSRYQSVAPKEGRSLYLLRRHPSGRTDTLAGGLTGHADGTGRGARFLGIDGMAWLNGEIVLTDGPRIRIVTAAGAVRTLLGELTTIEWDQDLLGVAAGHSGEILVADFAGRRVIRLAGKEATVAVTSGLFWSPTGVTTTANATFVLEHLRAPFGILGDLGIGPYLQVRRIDADGRATLIARKWGANSLVGAVLVAAVVTMILLLMAMRMASKRSRRRKED